jgi:predicted HNH restriction endonuclease
MGIRKELEDIKNKPWHKESEFINPKRVERRKLLLESRRDNLRDIKRRLVAMKGGKCQLCGKEYPTVCYDFHHRDRSLKIEGLTVLMQKYQSAKDFNKIVQEADKCDLLCSNCHRITHFGEY